MIRQFYRDGDKFLMTTGECPKGFKGSLFVVWEGPIDALKEGVKTQEQLKELEKVDDIDKEWLDAFAKAAGFDAEPVQKSEPKPAVPSARRDTQMDEFLGHCAVGTDPITAAAASGVFDSEQNESGIQVDPTFHSVVVGTCWLIAAALTLYIFL